MPPENSPPPTRQIVGHETEFDEGANPNREPVIVDQIDILPVQNGLPILLSVDHHVFVKQSVHSDVVERHLALDEFQVFLKICAQGFANPPTAVDADFIVIGHC